MLFDVYFFTGDPVDSLQAGAKTGELILKGTGRDNGLMAYLYAPGTKTDMLNPLRHAKLLAMNNGGMTIEGYVTIAERTSNKSKANTFAVRWVVKHVGAPAVLDAKKLQQRSAERLARVAISGFDAADDDALM